MASVVDLALFVRRALLEDPTIADVAVATSPKARGHLVQQLLLYDTIVIPTHDFGILRALVAWFGFDLLQDALQRKVLRFVRVRGVLAYVGNGGGLHMSELRGTPERPMTWPLEPMF